MAEKIGYQSGIAAFFNAFRKLHPEYTAAATKLERSITILKEHHDAGITFPPPVTDPPTKPEPVYIEVAPRVVVKQGSSDAIFCLQGQPGVRKVAPNHWVDAVASYDDNGKCKDGRRNPDYQHPGLVRALEVDNREPCSLPTVGDPKLNTGSWAI